MNNRKSSKKSATGNEQDQEQQDDDGLGDDTGVEIEQEFDGSFQDMPDQEGDDQSLTDVLYCLDHRT